MDSTELLILLTAIAIQTNVPILLMGEPGVAKTAIIGAIARVLGWPFLCKIGSVHDPTDFSGLPHMTENGVELLAFKWAKDFSQEAIGDKPALLFLDEITNAAQSTLAAMLKLVHEGHVGDTRLGSRVARIAAANPSDISNVPEMLPALSNRFCHLKWTLSPQYWVQATIAGYPDPKVPRVPDNWTNNLPQTLAFVASFISANQQLMHDRPKDESKWGGAWASPRTWTMAATLLAGAQSIGVGDDVQTALVEGCVGPGAAIAFMEYRRKLNLPHPEDVLRDPKGTKYPAKGDQLFALLNSVVSAILNNSTEERWIRGWEVLAAASEATGKMDVATGSAVALAKGRKAGYGTPQHAKAFYKTLNLAEVAKVPKRAAA